MDGVLNELAAAITAVIAWAGYAGVAALMALESACIPLPSEIIMPFAGYLVSTGRFNLVVVATAGAIGCNIGSTAAYFAAASGGRRLVERWGHLLLIGPEEVSRSERFFARYGAAAVLVGRLLPVVRTFIAVPAGLARMPQWRFQLYTFIGSWPWCLGLAYIGYKLGEQWDANPTLRSVFHQFDAAILIIVVVGAGWFVWRRIRASR